LWSVSKSYSGIRLEEVWDIIEVVSEVIRYISDIRTGTIEVQVRSVILGGSLLSLTTGTGSSPVAVHVNTARPRTSATLL